MRVLSRRQFLAVSLLGLAGGLTRAAAIDAPVGSQLYGWGQFYERQGKKISDHLDEVFTALHEAGYQYAEGFLDTANPDENARFAERSRAAGLQPIAIYTGGRLHEDEAAAKTIAGVVRAARVCSKSGFQVINCNPDPIGRAKTDAELKVQANSLNTLGRELRQLGLKLGVHNHTPEMMNGGKEFRHNLTATDPAFVGFCYDVHWVFRGGIKPEQALKEFGDRVVSWHVRQSKEGVWTEDLAEGDIDYGAVAIPRSKLSAPISVEIALENGTKVTRSAAENHRRSREYIRRVFGL